MATINDLMETVAYFGGYEPARVRKVGRYLRELGIFDTSSKGRTPQVEAVHAAALMIAVCFPDLQTRVVPALLALWNLSAQADDPPQQDMFSVVREGSAPTGELSFGRAMVAAISAYANDIHLGDNVVRSVAIYQGEAFASITYNDRVVHYHSGNRPGRTRPGRSPNRQPRTLTLIPWETLHWLGSLVDESRKQSAVRGIPIQTESIWLALEPPAPSDPHVLFPDSAPASLDAEPDKTKAVQVTSPDDLLISRQPKLASLNKTELTRVCVPKATPDSMAGPSQHRRRGQAQHDKPREDFRDRAAA